MGDFKDNFQKSTWKAKNKPNSKFKKCDLKDNFNKYYPKVYVIIII